MSCRYCNEKTFALCPFSIHLSKSGLIWLGFIQLLIIAGFVGITRIDGCIAREQTIVNSMDSDWEYIYRVIDEMPGTGVDSGDDRLVVLEDLHQLNVENNIDMSLITPEQQELFLSFFGNRKARAAIVVTKMTMKARYVRYESHVPGE